MIPQSTPLDLLLLAIALVVMPSLSIMAGRKLARTPRSELRLVPRYWFIIVRGGLISLLIILGWHGAGRPYADLGLDIPISFWGRIGFGFDALLAAGIAYGLLGRKVPADRVAMIRQRLASFRILPQTREEFALFSWVGVFGSSCEELLYRGFLMWFLTPLAGVGGAVLLSSILFGAGHAYLGWTGILRTTLIGVVFASAYALTHSLWWLIVAHVMVNLRGGLYARRLLRLSSDPQS